jgi:hypothetical protein
VVGLNVVGASVVGSKLVGSRVEGAKVMALLGGVGCSVVGSGVTILVGSSVVGLRVVGVKVVGSSVVGGNDTMGPLVGAVVANSIPCTLFGTSSCETLSESSEVLLGILASISKASPGPGISASALGRSTEPSISKAPSG